MARSGPSFGKAPSSTQTRLAAFAVAVLIALVWAWHVQFITVGGLSRYDEFYTYERSVSFARMEDWWAVYSANRPTLKKPPMQYWMGAVLMELGLRDVPALRLPSMIFAGLTLAATALLARVVLPGRPWAMLGAVLLLATAPSFWMDATSAMLDVGSALFVTLALTAMILALRDPRYWPVFVLCVFLGGLQKAPIALGFLLFALVALLLTARWQDRDMLRHSLRNSRFALWMLAALILAFAWPLLQGLRFPGEDAIQGSVEKEMFRRFTPSPDKLAGLDWQGFKTLILGQEPWLRGLGFLAVAALPFTERRPELAALSGVALIFVLVMCVASDSVYARYLLVVLPLLCVAIAGVLSRMLGSDLRALVGAALLCVLFGGPFKAQNQLALRAATLDGTRFEEILSPVAEALQPGELFLICELDLSQILPRGAYTVYSGWTGPITRLRRADVARALERERYTGGPIRGLCTEGELTQIADQLAELATTPLPGGHLQFTASGLSSGRGAQ